MGGHNQVQSCMCWRAGRTVHVQPASNYALKLVCVHCVAVHMYSADTQPSSRCERSVRAQPCVCQVLPINQTAMHMHCKNLTAKHE